MKTLTDRRTSVEPATAAGNKKYFDLHDYKFISLEEDAKLQQSKEIKYSQEKSQVIDQNLFGAQMLVKSLAST